MSATVNKEASRTHRFFRAIGPRRLSAIYLLIIFLFVFTWLNPETFLTSQTMSVVLGSGAVTCLLALAFMVPLATENYDLSVGVMMTFSLTLVTQLDLMTDFPILLNALITLIACALVGALSGFLVVRMKISSFIATLGVSQVLMAALLLISGNKQLVGKYPDYWVAWGNSSILGIPLPFWIVLVVGLVLWYVLEHMPVGRFLFAVGGNPEAARLSGVNTQGIVWGSLVTSAVIAGIAGLVYSMQIGVANASVGESLLFPAITAVFLGASQLTMRANVWGTILAYLALAIGIQGLRLTLGATAAWASPLFQGVALIIAVAIASRPIVAKLKSARKSREANTETALTTVLIEEDKK